MFVWLTTGALAHPVPSAGTVRHWVEVASADASIELVDSRGRVTHRQPVPDLRRRTLILHGGRGISGTVQSALVPVDVPWAQDSTVRLRGADAHFVQLADPGALRVTPVLENGPSSERLDLVILGDGYPESELDAFAEDVDELLAYLVEIEPYDRYAGLINLWRVDTPSQDAGISRPSADIERDTALGCAYDCAGSERLICCDEKTVISVAEAAVPGGDGILVLVNDLAYGGSGGFNYAVSYVGFEGTEVAAHELGHTLVGLWDEYAYEAEADVKGGPNCSPHPEGDWDEWLDRRGVDVFPVCSYDNLYRPTEDDCMMRTLRDGYCPVCRQATVLAMYEALPGLVESVQPPPSEERIVIPGVSGPAVPFEIQTIAPKELLTFEWSVDGEVVLAHEPNLNLRCTGLQGELTLRVYDATPWIRSRPVEEIWGPWQVRADVCPEPPPPAACGCQAGLALAPGWLAALTLLAAYRRRPRVPPH